MLKDTQFSISKNTKFYRKYSSNLIWKFYGENTLFVPWLPLMANRAYLFISLIQRSLWFVTDFIPKHTHPPPTDCPIKPVSALRKGGVEWAPHQQGHELQ